MPLTGQSIPVLPPIRREVLKAAVAAIGTPYSYGGGGRPPAYGATMGINPNQAGPNGQPVTNGIIGYDCAGLTRSVFRYAAHEFLAYGSQAQGREGQRVGLTLADLPLAMPGDLVFFNGSNNPEDPYGHVGIYYETAGTDQFGQQGPTIIHAPYPGQFVRPEVINPTWLNPIDIRSYCPRV